MFFRRLGEDHVVKGLAEVSLCLLAHDLLLEVRELPVELNLNLIDFGLHRLVPLLGECQGLQELLLQLCLNTFDIIFRTIVNFKASSLVLVEKNVELEDFLLASVLEGLQPLDSTTQ